MITFQNQLQKHLKENIKNIFSDLNPDLLDKIEVVQTNDERFGNYQCNIAMQLAKILKKSPQLIAKEILNKLSNIDFIEEPQIAGAGFINFSINNQGINQFLSDIILNDKDKKLNRLGVEITTNPKTIVIDFPHQMLQNLCMLGI